VLEQQQEQVAERYEQGFFYDFCRSQGKIIEVDFGYDLNAYMANNIFIFAAVAGL